jgi:DNA-binding transcriptional LysR family regulator
VATSALHSAPGLVIRLTNDSNTGMHSIHDEDLPNERLLATTDGAEGGLVARLARIDLNLLVAFDVLARERHVTRSAQRLGITQSAMSHALRRLRDLFGDELLVRGHGGLVLTARAEALLVPLRSGLVAMDRALTNRSHFDPKSTQRTFRLATPDLFDALAIPQLLEHVRTEAPAISLVVVPSPGAELSRLLETGELDFAIVPRGDQAQADPSTVGLVQRVLARDHLCCFCRADHPALAKRRGKALRKAPRSIPLEVYTQLSHALVSPTGEGPGLVDTLLEERGLQRRVVLRVPHFTTALSIVARSDLWLTAPYSLRKLIPADSPVVDVAAPLPLPGHALTLLWHERFSSEPGLVWLRTLLEQVTRTVVG